MSIYDPHDTHINSIHVPFFSNEINLSINNIRFYHENLKQHVCCKIILHREGTYREKTIFFFKKFFQIYDATINLYYQYWILISHVSMTSQWSVDAFCFT